MKEYLIRGILKPVPASAYLVSKHWLGKKINPRKYERMQRKRHLISSNGYTYKNFDDTRSIFIHVPKSAGLAVSRALYGNLAGGHKTLNGYMNIFAPAELLYYFKFAFVRNPYDRLVSAYEFLRRGGITRNDKEFFEKELSQFSSFRNFVQGWLTDRSVWKGIHFKPQYHFVCDPANKLHLDFLGRFENLEADFQYVASRLGVSAALPRTNSSSRDSYEKYYDNETREIVSLVYRRDLEVLGYDFYGLVGNPTIYNRVDK